MYSLSIHFGPNSIVWALLFKEEEKASMLYNAYVEFKVGGNEAGILIGADDFGQSFAIPFNAVSPTNAAKRNSCSERNPIRRSGRQWGKGRGSYRRFLVKRFRVEINDYSESNNNVGNERLGSDPGRLHSIRIQQGLLHERHPMAMVLRATAYISVLTNNC